MSFVECVLCNCKHFPEGGRRCEMSDTGVLPNDCINFECDVEVIVI